MRIILDPIGSEGDARPLAALGGALKKAGHEPLIAISPGLEYLAEQVGIPYVMSGLNVKELMAANPQVSAGKSFSTIKTFFRLADELVKGQIDFLCRIARPSDCIILSGAIPIGGTIAEKVGCKSFHAVHWPGMFPSPAYPHMFDQFYWCERIAHLGIGPRGFSINRLTVERLSDLLQSLLNNPLYRKRALQIAHGMQEQNGLDKAVVHIGK
jgi:UDP:flavonoid glycosyltransferase YjiC (YdhE family)